jgi:hypothetical protein
MILNAIAERLERRSKDDFKCMVDSCTFRGGCADVVLKGTMILHKAQYAMKRLGAVARSGGGYPALIEPGGNLAK